MCAQQRVSDKDRPLNRSLAILFQDIAPDPDRVCAKIAQLLNVKWNEVALLRLEKGGLRFLYPKQLRGAGVIPLTGSAVAARTAVTRVSLLSNTFARVRHASLFESVRLKGTEVDDSAEQMPIQKIISVPILNAERKVIGVVQVSRKGADPTLAGPDFTGEELRQVEGVADVVGNMPFMREEIASAAEAGT